jgi:hypothetical protein
MVSKTVEDLVVSKEERLESIPAVSCSSPNFAIFFYLDAKELESGLYVQGIPGRINLRPSQRFSLPGGREVLLPDMDLDIRGTVAVSPDIHQIYTGFEGISRFFRKFPCFEVYKQYIENFT